MAKRNNFTEEDINNIIKLHNNGLLDREIAERYNTSRSSISRVLQKSDIPSRHPRMSKERENMIMELYEKCEKITDIPKHMNVTLQTVKNVLEKNGINIPRNYDYHTKYNYNINYFDVIDTGNKAYIMGILFADGCVAKNDNSVSIMLQDNDEHILKSIRDEISPDKPIYHYDLKSKHPTHNNVCALHFTNKHIHDTLINHGVIPNKSLMVEFPKCIPEELYSKFFLGILDGDGCISKDPKSLKCSFVSTEKFCLRAKEIIEDKLKIHCSICYTCDKTKPTRTLQISGRYQVKKFLDWLYDGAELYLFRKYDIYKKLYL